MTIVRSECRKLNPAIDLYCVWSTKCVQVCPLNNQSLVLGVLVDLCENPKVNIRSSSMVDPILCVCVLLLLRLFHILLRGEGERETCVRGLCWPLSGGKRRLRWECLALIPEPWQVTYRDPSTESTL